MGLAPLTVAAGAAAGRAAVVHAEKSHVLEEAARGHCVKGT